MIIKNKGYAAFLVITHGYEYTITKEKEIDIPITFDTHDSVYRAYKKSSHRKMQSLFIKFLNLTNNN